MRGQEVKRMNIVSRREAIAKLVQSSAGVAFLNLTGLEVVNADQMANILPGQDSVAGQAPLRAFRGLHQLKPLAFNPAKLAGISEKLIRSHWENNYGGAVKALNAVEQRLDMMLKEKDLPAYMYGDLKREELVRTGSVVLHEYYFGNLGGDGHAGGKALDLLKQWFGSYEQWESEFKKTASALGGGSGWVTLAYNFHTGEIHNYWSWDHMHNTPTGLPLLVLDMYEHAYHMDYGSAAAKYIDTFLKNVNWEEVNRRLEVVMKFGSS
jgi:superoxide dismutase, Fe-Mn family